MDNYIEHHGILGQKWGVRRYQNKDGSYTEAGKKHRGYDTSKDVKTSHRTKRLENRVNKTTAKRDYDVNSFDAITEDLKYSRGKRAGQTFYSVEDAKRDQKRVAERYDQKLNKQKQKLEISKTRDMFNSQAKLGERLVYNEATRKRAAKYIVKNNMSYEDAISKAHGDAWANTIYFGLTGIALAGIFKNYT